MLKVTALCSRFPTCSQFAPDFLKHPKVVIGQGL